MLNHTVQNQTNTTLFNAIFPGLGIADYTLTERGTYELVDIRIGVAEEHWSVTLVGRNITDEEYLEENITAPEFGGSFSHPGTRSRWGVEFGYRF